MLKSGKKNLRMPKLFAMKSPGPEIWLIIIQVNDNPFTVIIAGQGSAAERNPSGIWRRNGITGNAIGNLGMIFITLKPHGNGKIRIGREIEHIAPFVNMTVKTGCRAGAVIKIRITADIFHIQIFCRIIDDIVNNALA